MAVAERTASGPVEALETTRLEETTLASGRGRAVLASFTGAHFSHHVSNSLLNPMLPFIRDSFALSYSQSGLLVSAFALSLGIANAPIGALADRIGSRKVIVAGLILTGAISVAVGLAGDYWHLLVLLVLMGLIAGSYHAPAAALIARSFPSAARGTAMGLHITGGHLSFFVAPLVAALMIGAGGTWRSPYIWLAFAPIVAGLVVWQIAPRGHERAPGGVSRLAVFRELWSVVRIVGPLVGVSMIFQMLFTALIAFTSLYLVDERGIPATLAAIYFGVPQLVGVLGAPLGGLLSDRVGRRVVILIGMGLLGPAFLALTLVPTALLLVPLVAIGIASTMRSTVTEVLVMDSAPPHRRATVLGGYYLVAQHSGGFAAPVLGVLAATLGIGPAFGGVCVALAILSIAAVLGQGLFSRTPSTPAAS